MEIVDYPNYLIYPDGRVYSKKSDMFLRPRTCVYGYKMVSLWNQGKAKTSKVHRLVAMHYMPNPENKREVDHMNRDKLDNRVENLRWATRTENNQNKGNYKNNTSGHKYISYRKKDKNWIFYKRINKKVYRRSFKSKIDALCYKFIFLLMLKAEIVSSILPLK